MENKPKKLGEFRVEILENGCVKGYIIHEKDEKIKVGIRNYMIAEVSHLLLNLTLEKNKEGFTQSF
jgi:hypothetical protein